MENQRTITLHAQEIRKDKQAFIACAAEINGKWYKIKFTKGCVNAPREKGLYSLTVNFDDCSLEQGKPYTNKDGKKKMSNDVLWVRNIVHIAKFTEDELREMNRAVMNDVFGC